MEKCTMNKLYTGRGLGKGDSWQEIRESVKGGEMTGKIWAAKVRFWRRNQHGGEIRELERAVFPGQRHAAVEKILDDLLALGTVAVSRGVGQPRMPVDPTTIFLMLDSDNKVVGYQQVQQFESGPRTVGIEKAELLYAQFDNIVDERGEVIDANVDGGMRSILLELLPHPI
jgi:hypothetical protein